MTLIRYHAAARELAGRSDEEFDFEGTPAALRDHLAARHPTLAPYLGRMRFAVNGAFATDATPIAAGDEVDVLPPVAGGSGAVLADVRDTPLSVDEAMEAVRHDGAGGIALFVGVVRDHADGKPVARLDYEAARDLAIAETRRILEGIAAEIPGARLAAVHRVGSLAVGDLAVVVAASAPHRGEAFQACRLAIDRIKETVPIWKKEWGPDGTAHWVNLEG